MLARPTRVLIAHRDPDLRQMLQIVLGEAGFEAAEFPTADEALSDAARCDLIILGWDEATAETDLTGGLGQTQLVRRTQPLLVLCGDVQRTRQEIGPLRDCELLQEPFSVDSFLDQIERILDSQPGCGSVERGGIMPSRC